MAYLAGKIRHYAGLAMTIHYVYILPSVSTIGYALWLRLGWRFFLACLWVVLWDYLAVGAIVASIMW